MRYVSRFAGSSGGRCGCRSVTLVESVAAAGGIVGVVGVVGGVVDGLVLWSGDAPARFRELRVGLEPRRW